MKFRMVALAALLMGVSAHVVCGQVGTGVISGLVADEAGRPEPGARVTCQKQSEYTRDAARRLVLKAPGFVRTVAADGWGKFQVAELPPGRYHVCADGVKANQVGSCHWGGVGVIELGAGQRLDGIVRTVRAGALLTINVADPNGRIVLADAQGFMPRQGRFVLELVSPTGSQRRAERISGSASGHVYQLTVPKQWAMRMFLDTDLTVRGESGDLLETRRPTALVVSAAGRDQVRVNLSVP